MKTAVAILSCTVLLGCANRPIDADYRQCMDAAAANPKYAPLKSKVALGKLSEQNLQILSNQERVSDSEKPLLSAWSAERRQCFLNADATIQKTTHPKVYSLILKSQSDVQLLATRLYSGQITYGEFAEGRQLIDTIQQQARADLAATVADEQKANERQVLLMQLQALQNKPAPTPAPQPYMIPTRPTVTTNCTTVAGQVNCVSR